MDHNLQQLISSELRPGEGVTYSARAIPSHGLKAFGIWLFAIPWTVFSVAWEIGVTAMFWSEATKPGEPFQWMGIVMAIFGIPFIVIGFGMLGSPFWIMKQLGKRFYFVTNQRVILFQDGRKREIQSVPLNLIAETIRREDRKGAGDLVIGLNTRRDSDGDKVTEERKVAGILNVKAFEEAVLSAKRRMSERAGVD